MRGTRHPKGFEMELDVVDKKFNVVIQRSFTPNETRYFIQSLTRFKAEFNYSEYDLYVTFNYILSIEELLSVRENFKAILEYETISSLISIAVLYGKGNHFKQVFFDVGNDPKIKNNVVTTLNIFDSDNYKLL